MVRGKQFTVCWHVDDVKASHATQEALDEFAEWVQDLYGEYSDVKVTRGKEHNYLGAKLIFEDDGVIVDMRKYLQEMFDEFPEELTGNVKTPANDNLFKILDGATPLSREKSIAFHSIVTQIRTSLSRLSMFS